MLKVRPNHKEEEDMASRIDREADAVAICPRKIESQCLRS